MCMDVIIDKLEKDIKVKQEKKIINKMLSNQIKLYL